MPYRVKSRSLVQTKLSPRSWRDAMFTTKCDTVAFIRCFHSKCFVLVHRLDDRLCCVVLCVLLNLNSFTHSLTHSLTISVSTNQSIHQFVSTMHRIQILFLFETVQTNGCYLLFVVRWLLVYFPLSIGTSSQNRIARVGKKDHQSEEREDCKAIRHQETSMVIVVVEVLVRVLVVVFVFVHVFAAGVGQCSWCHVVLCVPCLKTLWYAPYRTVLYNM
uniref:Transmembrane protein n=1 Tax=Pseudo-nitzschia australis TaxID=44445 RepID=A0A7S4EI13_9STRA|mmetsp:Transcript_19813/g.41749  ORF Transcript_19813/g.41749 Transcript_19813/m.41749 type:complete len:217 (-) Transcript_19813:67-717(-)